MEYETFMHELKNPLGVIYGVAQLFKAGAVQLDDKLAVNQMMTIIINSVKNIKAIESDFSMYMKTSRHHIKYEIVNVKTILANAAIEYKSMAVQHGVTIRTRLAKAKAFIDLSKFKQIINNVLSNAIKYTEQGGVVTIKCRTVKGNMHIIVSDTGIGMSKKELELVGQPFYRSKVLDRPGTGLGLCTVIKLANMLKFEMDIKSIVGTGTTIHFTLRQIQ